jgi:AcrR family transcriptional regulator
VTTRERLSADRIYRAALDLIDEAGLPALNMRRLGSALNVEAMALYRHVPNKQAILDGVVDNVLSGLDAAVNGANAQPAAERFFTSLHGLLLRHPNALPLVTASAFRAGQTKTRAATVLRIIKETGLDEEAALDAFHTLTSFTLGYTWLEVGGFVGELPDATPFMRAAVAPVKTVAAGERPAEGEKPAAAGERPARGEGPAAVGEGPAAVGEGPAAVGEGPDKGAGPTAGEAATDAKAAGQLSEAERFQRCLQSILRAVLPATAAPPAD